MSKYLTEENSVETVLSRINDEECTPRFRQIMTALVTHLHDFIKEVDLTQAEWETGIDFLTRAGQTVKLPLTLAARTTPLVAALGARTDRRVPIIPCP